MTLKLLKTNILWMLLSFFILFFSKSLFLAQTTSKSPNPLGEALFVSGADGYDTYRIPSILVTKKGTILAFCEGRKKSKSDTGDIDLLVKRSTDNGKTWSLQKILWDDNENTCGNPCAVLDDQSGRIILLSTWNRGDDHESEIIDQTSNDTRRVFIMYSENDGLTFSEPKEITETVKKSNWTWYATGPGSGIQIENGPFAGRLVIPCDHIVAETKARNSHVIFSDDGGDTWQLGDKLPRDGVNECQVVELLEGKLMLNLRNSNKSARNRQVALSDDGGMTWKDQRFDPTLIEPICQASIERFSWPSKGKRSVILFSNPANMDARKEMTVRASYDEGRTWPIKKILHSGPSAYSDMAVLSDNSIACLYEGGIKFRYESIYYSNFSLSSFYPDREFPENVQEIKGNVELEVQDLFDGVRSPKIIVSKNGTILAFAGGCKFLRRSEDKGITWSQTEIVNPDGSGNVIIDENSGDVLVVCPLKSFLWRSKDIGKTWVKEEITLKPNKIGHGTIDGIPVDVNSSESGITLLYGKYKGRLVMPARVQIQRGAEFNENKMEYWQYQYNTAIYSDDGGKIWQVGEPVQSGTGEGVLAEIADGRIYFNSRSHMAVDCRRQIAWSYDGGHRWVNWEASNQLFEVGGPFYYKYGGEPSYGCNAGLVRLPEELTGGRDILIYSTQDNPGAISPYAGRIRLTVWVSTNGGKSWDTKHLVYNGLSTYSSLSADRNGNIYLLFERGEKKLYEKISFIRFNLEWLGLEL